MLALVKGYNCGVYFGEIVSVVGDKVEMKDARNLFYWKGAFNLSDMSIYGVTDPAGSHATSKVDVTLMGVDTILPLWPDAYESLSSIPIKR